MNRFTQLLGTLCLLCMVMGSTYAKGVLSYDPAVGISIKGSVEKAFLNTIVEYGEKKILIVEQISAEDLKVLANIKDQIIWLKIVDSPALTELKELAALTNLERLELVNLPQIEDLSALSVLTKLKHLHLTQVNVRDIAFVRSLPSIETLIFEQQPKEPLDISPLESKYTLKVLRFGGAKIDDLSPIAYLTNLTELSLARTQVNDLSALSKLTSLEILDLTGVKATKLKPIESLTKLKWIKISATRFHDYQVLANCTKLQTLIAGGSRLNRLDIVESMPNLTTLKLFKDPIRNLEPLAKARQLETLHIRHMHANLTALTNLRNLKDLSLEKARVINPEAISKLSALEVLDLRGVINLKDLSLLLPLSKLRLVYVLRADYPSHQTSMLGNRVVFQ